MWRLGARAVASWWVRFGITAAILAYLSATLDLRAAAAAVLRVDRGYLALVLALVAIDRAVMILRWVMLLRASGIQIATSQAASIFLISSFVGSFLPAGIGGDAARAVGLARAAATGSDAVASVGVDRILGIVSLVLLGVAGLLLWVPAGGADPRVFVVALLLAAASASAFWMDRLVRLLLPQRWHSWAAVALAMRVGDAVGRYRARPGVLVRVLVWSLVVQVLRVGQAYFLGLGLGLTVPFGYYLVFMPVGLLMLLLPISISGFGLPQGVIVWLLQPVGVPEELSFALATLIVLTGLAGNLPGLILWLWRRDSAPV